MTEDDSGDERVGDAIAEALRHAAHLLPDQGPIDVFIHHNTLHAFQHMPFHDAVREAALTLGAEPYMSEEAYRTAFRGGRIGERDLAYALAKIPPNVGPTRGLIGRELFLRLAMVHPIENMPAQTLRFLLEEGELLAGFASDVSATARSAMLAGARRVAKRGEIAEDEASVVSAMWTQALRLARGVRNVSATEDAQRPVLRARDKLLAQGADDADALVHPVLVRWASAYLDLGQAYWAMPRSGGFYATVSELIASAPLGASWLMDAQRLFADQHARGLGAAASVGESLASAGVAPAQYEAFLAETLLALPGWAGMFSRLERTPPATAPSSYAPSLLDFVAVRLVLDRAAAASVKGHHRRAQQATPEQRELSDAYRLFRLLQLAGVPLDGLLVATPADGAAMLDALDGFSSLQRRRLWHEAYEVHHRWQMLDAIAQNRQREAQTRHPSPWAQLIVCFDDREESLRRYVEELDDGVATFGTAGFFGLPIEFVAIERGAADAMCPANQRPAHTILEEPEPDARQVHLTRKGRRRSLGQLLRASHVGSRTLVRGAVMTMALGAFSALPLLTRVLSPRVASAVRRSFDGLMRAPSTRLRALRAQEEEDAPIRHGYRPEEAAERLERLLRELGLVDGFAELVFTLGHGASSSNNPHASAYDCGACSGKRGLANGRLFAHLANEPEVRKALAARGIVIPDTTRFVGGWHDTTRDAIHLADLSAVPPTHHAALEKAIALFEEARRLNALERCRRFEAASLSLDPDEALAHVELRAESLSEPRAECGHATNAVGIVGRRALTQGLFLDRRAFVISYDPTIDPDGAILERILAAAAPVGGGINLEYYFSYIDNERYGSGTKLPHNLTSMLGVMSGGGGDLRTGLPWQMVEIHEPVRLLVVVESTPEMLGAIAARNKVVGEFVGNGWILLASIHPETGAIAVFDDGAFVPYEPSGAPLPVVSSSRQYIAGERGHLPPARIEKSASRVMEKVA